MNVMPEQTLKRWMWIQNEAKDEFIKKFDLSPGHHVLVLCCGTGEEVFKIREIIGDEGQIVAIDIDELAIAKAQKLNFEKNYKNVKFLVKDAADVSEYYGLFDRVCCLFGVNYFDNYKNIISIWKKCLKDTGGKIGLSIWQKSEENEVIDNIYKITYKYLNLEEEREKNTKKEEDDSYDQWKNIETYQLKYDLTFPNAISYWKSIRNNFFFKSVKKEIGIRFNSLENDINQYLTKLDNPPITEKLRIKLIFAEK